MKEDDWMSNNNGVPARVGQSYRCPGTVEVDQTDTGLRL